MILRVRVLLCLVTILAAIQCVAAGQFCSPAVVSYIVRDAKGAVLSEAQLNSVSEQLPKAIGDATVETDQVSFMNDLQTFHWHESVDWEGGKKLPALEFVNAGTCNLHLGEVTLTWGGKQMHLVFNLDVGRDQYIHRTVIDSLPFQEGTFALDLSQWSRDLKKMIPSDSWKRIKTNPARRSAEQWRSNPLLNKKSG